MRGLRWVCCGMLIATVAAGCKSAGPTMTPPPQTTVDVRIGSDCRLVDSSQEMVTLDYTPPASGPYNTQVRWIVDKGPDDTAVITAKLAAYQDPSDPDHGKKVRDMLNGTFVMGPGQTEKLSGRPKYTPPYKKKDGKDQPVGWYYSIDIVRAQGDPCHYGPGLCYRTADGSWVCSR